MMLYANQFIGMNYGETTIIKEVTDSTLVLQDVRNSETETIPLEYIDGTFNKQEYGNGILNQTYTDDDTLVYGFGSYKDSTKFEEDYFNYLIEL